MHADRMRIPLSHLTITDLVDADALVSPGIDRGHWLSRVAAWRDAFITLAGRDIALAQYEKAIQGAFKEVNDALASRHWLADQQAAQQRLVAAEAERVRLSTLRVDQGVAGQLELLDAQRSLFAAQQSLLQTQLALSLNRVALFKATAGA